MRSLRVLSLIMMLLPGVAVAIPCCDVSSGVECCGPEGDCPLAPSGECALSGGSAPLVSVTSLSLVAPAGVRVSVELSAAPFKAAAPPILTARHARPTPLYLSLGTLRN